MDSLAKYVDEKWRWQHFKDFFGLTVLRYLVLWFSLVPVLAGILIQLPDPITITIGGQEHEVSLNLPFSWQILWLSSLSFMLALGFYKIRCPGFIKKYNSYTDYASYSHDHRWMSWEAFYMWNTVEKKQKSKFINVMFDKKKLLERVTGEFDRSLLTQPNIQEDSTVSYFEHGNQVYKLAFPMGNGPEASEDIQKGVFYEIFGRYSASNEISRWIVWILLLVSLGLFIIVLIQHVCTGGVYVLRWILGAG